MTLRTGGKAVELGGETETGGEGAADSTTVVATECITTAGDGACITLVLYSRYDGNSGDEAGEEC